MALGPLSGPASFFGMRIPDAAVVSAARLSFVRHAASRRRRAAPRRASQPIGNESHKSRCQIAVARRPFALPSRFRPPRRTFPPRGFAVPRASSRSRLFYTRFPLALLTRLAPSLSPSLHLASPGRFIFFSHPPHCPRLYSLRHVSPFSIVIVVKLGVDAGVVIVASTARSARFARANFGNS